MKNGKIKKLILIGIMATAVLAFMTSCSTWDNFKYSYIEKSSDEDVIYIGVFEPQTGKYAEIGKDEIKGIELANSIYNNVNGMDIELIKVDTQSNPNSAKSAIQTLVDMKPIAIIGSASEAESLVASPVIQEAKIPTITPSAVNPLITQDSGYYFRASTTNDQMGAGLAEYAYSKLGSTKIAIFDVRNDSAVSAYVDGFKDSLEEISGSTSAIVLSDSITVTDNNWKSILKSIKKSGADTVFLPIGVENVDSFFTAVEKQNMTNITFLGPKTWGTDEFAKIAKNHPSIKVAFPYDTVVSKNKSTKNTVTAETQRFLIEYAQKYGENDTPSEYAALGYDSYLLIVNAINNAKSFSGPAVRDALSKLSGMQCATGVFQFDSMGNTVRSVNIATVKDGLIVSAYVTQGTSESKQIEEIDK